MGPYSESTEYLFQLDEIGHMLSASMGPYSESTEYAITMRPLLPSRLLQWGRTLRARNTAIPVSALGPGTVASMGPYSESTEYLVAVSSSGNVAHASMGPYSESTEYRRASRPWRIIASSFNGAVL